MHDPDRAPNWLQLESVIKMPKAEEITSLSADSIRREYPNLIVQLSARRDGIKLRDALDIAAGRAKRRA
jgi:hypothetical protein